MNTSQQKLVKIFLNKKDKNEILHILLVLLTDNEFKEMVNRLEILRLLDKGVPQREIAQQLGVGVATVTRGTKVLGEYQKYIK